jgi:hypothetical protein
MFDRLVAMPAEEKSGVDDEGREDASANTVGLNRSNGCRGPPVPKEEGRLLADSLAQALVVPFA